MYFIFSKVLLFLILPLNWIIVLLLTAMFSKNQKTKRLCLISGTVLLMVFTNSYLLSLFSKNWDISPASLSKSKTYSTVIVLGGFTGEDKYGKGYFDNSADRFIEGLKLKQSGKVSHILISSGNGSLKPDSFREATWAKVVLKEFNLPDSAILIEQNSRNTIENAAFSKQLLNKERLPPPYLLVTSAWHMRRALYIFKKSGLDVIPYSSGRISQNINLSFDKYFMPDASVLAEWNTYLKELVGLAVAHLK